mgnify:CR=1 FL=1
MKWNVNRRFKNGIPIINTKRFLGYTKDKKGGNLVIVPEEAKIVKMIFEMYIQGWGPEKIAKFLEEKGYKTGSGSNKWRITTVTSMLKNEKYAGDLLQQKTIITDYLTHKKIRNKNVAPTYLTENNHEAIISKEKFLLAKQIRLQKQQDKIGDNKDITKYSNRYPFTSMIVCSKCGRTLKRRHWNYGKPSQRVVHQCGNYLEGKGNCDAKAVSHDLIEGATLQMLNDVFIEKRNIIPAIRKIIKSNILVHEEENKIEILKTKIDEVQDMISNVIDMKAKKAITEDQYKSKYLTYTGQLNQYEKEIKVLEKLVLKNFNAKQRLELIDKVLSNKQSTALLEPNVMQTIIHKMIAVTPDELVFCILGEREISDDEFVKNRDKYINLESIMTGRYVSDKLNRHINYKVVVI